MRGMEQHPLRAARLLPAPVTGQRSDLTVGGHHPLRAPVDPEVYITYAA